MASVDQAPASTEGATRTLTLLEAVREALHEEMARDPRVVVLGEDVGRLGGVFRATDGLLDAFGPERVIDTPMMELGIAGLAVGMAMRGLRPVAEIQFADFMHAAADHIISDAARLRFRSGGDWTCPLVVRTAYGGGLRGGPYHSQSVEAYYCHVPGLRVVEASFPADAKGLLVAAIRHPDPVLFLEHKRTYRAIRGEVPSGENVVPLDRARVARPGRHATVVAWGWVLHEALAAAERLAEDGIEVEVIDPRTLNPLDTGTLLESVRRTGRLCVVHEDTRTLGLGAEIAALVAETALDELRAPVRRVTMPDVAGIPASGPMEDFLVPDRDRVAAALRELVAIERGQRTMLPVDGADRAPAGAAARVGAVRADDAAAAGAERLGAQPGWRDALLAGALQVPQASSVVEVDLSRVAQRLERGRAVWASRGLEPDYTAFFAEALLAALARVPHANAAFATDGQAIQRYPVVHLGLAVARADGAGAAHAVAREADTLNLLGLAGAVQRVRQTGSALPDALADATVTLTDFGAGSALFAVPLVLPGQAVAVRVGAVEERVLARERGFAVVPAAYVCASIDHRVLDGLDAGSLLGELKRFLESYPLDAEPMGR
jgi:2-oxoisovalerate dehydrogenase E1 component beta subunit